MPRVSRESASQVNDYGPIASAVKTSRELRFSSSPQTKTSTGLG
jgi:hypothetical protein